MNKKEEIAYRKKHKFVNRYAKGIKLDVRNKGYLLCNYENKCRFSWTVYIDAMDGLD